MIVELISVGTEILLGNIVNTNAAYLSEKCAVLGLSQFHQSAVGDNPKRLEDAIILALSRADILILSGGLGPTKDDLTKETAAKVMNKNLVQDIHTKERIQEYLQKVIPNHMVTENNWKQAMVPEGAIIIDNLNGTAPGIIMEDNGKRIILLPGPPNELIPMFQEDIVPYLNKLQPELIYSKMVKICGLGESYVETQIMDLIEEQTNPTVAPYAKTGEVHLRITAKARNEEDAMKLVAPVVTELKKRFQDAVFTTEERVTLEEAVVELLKERELTVTTVESCTGGLLAGKIINVAGVSDCYKEGYITYSNEAKKRLVNVSESTLAVAGAVSEECAKEMAIGGAQSANADVCIAITGIAGPDGGTQEKPVGLVYEACYYKGNVEVNKFLFKGNRDKIREQAVVKALTLLRKNIIENK
ncbi:competence/damage-inducible protein A [Anaerosacchariphilus polymeriproducens]|uniref:Putative competence-damage inducible protein n=1 Tax=Anaerosacchariphilus polymeriproducens TaxID=1812858 RepID=A0A371AZ77_9FIRM|nr:competence/damage-inducible protein A [Anaerosacchariphilus polymeriproducens]RDU24849.1 competence/damage-inducible protein A [Anaerosacchariphilus polymeriproducens]